MSIWTDMMIYQYKNLEFCTSENSANKNYSLFPVSETIPIKEDTTASLTEKKIAEFQPKLDGRVTVYVSPTYHSVDETARIYNTVIIRDSTNAEIARARAECYHSTSGSYEVVKVTFNIDVKAFETYSISYFANSTTNNVTPQEASFYAYVKPKNYNNFLISKEVD